MSADNWTTCPKCGGEFREDWEIGVYPGDRSFYINYRGSCRQCLGGITFEHETDALSVFKEATA